MVATCTPGRPISRNFFASRPTPGRASCHESRPPMKPRISTLGCPVCGGSLTCCILRSTGTGGLAGWNACPRDEEAPKNATKRYATKLCLLTARPGDEQLYSRTLIVSWYRRLGEGQKS